jgi:hypothetical protein
MGTAADRIEALDERARLWTRYSPMMVNPEHL